MIDEPTTPTEPTEAEPTEAEPTEAELKKAKRKRIGMNILKGVGFAALVVGHAAAANSRSMSRPGSGWNANVVTGAQLEREAMARRAAQQRQQQWEPWMSQGQLNPYNGRTYYPMNYGTRF